MVFEAIYQTEGDYGIILFDLPTSLEELLAMGRIYDKNNILAEEGKETWVELLLPRDFLQGSTNWAIGGDDTFFKFIDLEEYCTHYLAHRYEKSPRFNRSTWDHNTYALSSRNQTSVGWLRLDKTVLNLSQTRLMWPNGYRGIAGTRYLQGYKLQLSLSILQRIYDERPFIRGLGVVALEEDFWRMKAGERNVIRLKSVYGSDSPFFENHITFNYPQGGVL